MWSLQKYKRGVLLYYRVYTFQVNKVIVWFSTPEFHGTVLMLNLLKSQELYFEQDTSCIGNSGKSQPLMHFTSAFSCIPGFPVTVAEKGLSQVEHFLI
jgi:hypothetical protein